MLFISFFCWFHILCLPFKLLSFLLVCFPGWCDSFYGFMPHGCRQELYFRCKPMDSLFPFVFYCMHTRKVQEAHKVKFWCIWGKVKEYSNLHEDGVVYKLQEKSMTRTSLVVQWLRICPAISRTILFMRMQWQCTASLYIGLSALEGGRYPNPR